MTATRGQALDQRRARHAWERVQAIRGDRRQRQDYAREAKKLPVRIRAAGLGHALAFLAAKKHRALVTDLDDWVLEQRKLPGAPEARCLTEAIVKGNAAFLQLATDEALAWLLWLTRFAEAELGDGGD